MTGRLTVVDTVAEFREQFGVESPAGRAARVARGAPLPELPEHDWRFKVTFGPGDDYSGRVTFHRHATAEQVVADLARNGIKLERVPDA